MSFGRVGVHGGFGGLGLIGGNSSFLINPSNPADVQLNFTSNRAWTKSSGVFSSASSLLTVTRASVGFVNDGSGNWTSISSNLPRISNLGLLVEEARTNLFLNSAVPATQTITVANGSTYSVSVIGTGSLVLTGAMTGTVTQGSPVIGATSTTSLTVTTAGITGTFINAQVELGASVTSPIVTAGASASRSADVVTLTSPPAFGAAYSLFAKGAPQTPTTYPTPQRIFEIDDGTAANAAIVARNSATGQPLATLTGGTGGNLTPTGGPWAQSVSRKIVLAAAAADQAAVFNGGTVATSALAVLPSSLAQVAVGNRPGADRAWNGFVEQAAIWSSQRLTNATLQAITT
jgi:hypothetical protein